MRLAVRITSPCVFRPIVDVFYNELEGVRMMMTKDKGVVLFVKSNGGGTLEWLLKLRLHPSLVIVSRLATSPQERPWR